MSPTPVSCLHLIDGLHHRSLELEGQRDSSDELLTMSRWICIEIPITSVGCYWYPDSGLGRCAGRRQHRPLAPGSTGSIPKRGRVLPYR